MQPIVRKINVQNVLTKSNLPASDYSVNPYVGCVHACKYCYASFMKRFTNHPEPWGGFLDVKYWTGIPNPAQYEGKELFFGSVTDPYNPFEETYERTRTLLKQLQGYDINLTIQTKSDLVLRDIELIKTFPNAQVGFSINTLDENFKNDMDKAVSIERRLNAMKVLHDNKVRTSCFISPIFPYITDVEAIIERVKKQCNVIWLENLNLRGSYKNVILNYIAEKYPNLLSYYNLIYIKGDKQYWEILDEKIKEYALSNNFEYTCKDDSRKRPFDATPIIVNYFYHEKIRKSAQKSHSSHS